MIRAPKLAPSRPMYAFKPETWRSASSGFEVDAVWFKRTKGVLAAVMGTYHPMVECVPRPTCGTYEAWIAAADDNRYGGGWIAKWNGTGLVCFKQPVAPELAAERIEFLDAVLKGFPNVPAGHDGWWTMPKEPK